MKNKAVLIVYLYLVLWGGVILNGATPAPYLGDQKLKLSENQDFIVTDSAVAGEYVGTIKAYPKIYEVYGTPSFVKTGGSSAFHVDSAGLITVTDPSALSQGEATIQVRVYLAGFTPTDIDVDIDILNSADCTFVDVSRTSDGDGSRALPRNIMPRFSDNIKVLFKRGTRLATGTIYIQNMDNILIASYGTGVKPVIEATAMVAFRIYYGCKDPVVRDLELTTAEPARSNPAADYSNWANGPVRVSSAVGKFRMINCEVHHSRNGIIDNSTGNMNGSPIPLSDNSEIRWNYVHDVAQEGLYVQAISGTGDISCNKIVRNNLLWNYNQAENISSGDGIQTYDVKRVIARNNYIDRSATGNKFNIIAQYNHNNTDGTEWVEITDNYLIGNAGGAGGGLSGSIIYADFAHGKITGNVMVGVNGNRGIASAHSTSDCLIAYNVFKDLGDVITDRYAGIYNNLFYGCSRGLTNCIGSVRNNIFWFTAPGQMAYHFQLPVPSDYNMFNRIQDGMFGNNGNDLTAVRPEREQNSIVGDPLIMNVSGNDFRVRPYSAAVNRGIATGLTVDFYGISIVGLPDIGVSEYSN